MKRVARQMRMALSILQAGKLITCQQISQKLTYKFIGARLKPLPFYYFSLIAFNMHVCANGVSISTN